MIGIYKVLQLLLPSPEAAAQLGAARERERALRWRPPIARMAGDR